MTKRKANSKRRVRSMADSAALMEAALKQRKIMPVLVSGVELAKGITVIQPKDFGRLNVCEAYQRVKITGQVNALITVLRAQGQIADPVDIAEREDGSWWIVDGQQRFWAHAETDIPLRAHVHKVSNLAAETNLFLALNARTRVTARTMAKGWPGPAGDLLRRLNENEESPLCGLIDFTNNSKLPLDAPTVVKGMLAVTTGTVPTGEMSTRLLPRLDVALREPGMLRWAEEFARLIAAVFDMNKGAGRVRMLPVVALGRVAHRKFHASGRPVYPKGTGWLRRVNWDTLVPSHSQRFLPLIENEMEKRWRDI